jgi:hypothetical protein
MVILKGLGAGEKVIASGLSKIKEGLRVRAQ